MKEDFIIRWEWAVNSWQMVFYKHLSCSVVSVRVFHYELLYLSQFLVHSAHYLSWGKLQWSALVQGLLNMWWLENFPGGPVAKIWSSQCRGPGSN